VASRLVLAASLVWPHPLAAAPTTPYRGAPAAPQGGGLAPTNLCFVLGLYHDLLGRPPSSAEQSNGLSFLVSNGRTVYASLLLGETPYQTVLIQGYYQKFLGRPANGLEVSAGIAILNAPGTDEDVVKLIAGSVEYFDQARVGGDNTNLIKALYPDLLGRPAISTDIIFGLSYLGSHTRLEYITLILSSTEYKAALIQGWYGRYLGRAATFLELGAAETSLSGGSSDEDVIAGLLGQTEYFNRAGLCGLYLPLVRR